MGEKRLESLRRETFVSEVREYPVAINVEALALGWLRTEAAPHGALVVASQEISARTRNDEPMSAAAINAAVAVRLSMPADHADILFAAALLAAAEGCVTFDESVVPRWPEFVVSEAPVGSVRVVSQLSPGAVDTAVMTFRLGFNRTDRGEVALRATMASLGNWLECTPAVVAAAYTEACGFRNRRVRVNLRPRGSAGGIGAGVDERGAFGVRSSSGSVARHRVDEIRSIELEG